MRLSATRLSATGNNTRRMLPNLLRSSGTISESPWATYFYASVSGITLTFTADPQSQVQQYVLPPGGNSSKIFTAAARVSCSSGTVGFRLKNTQGQVADRYSDNLTATTTPTIFVFTATNAAAAGNGSQIFGVMNKSTGGGAALAVHATALFEGAWTAQQIADLGGIPIT